MGDTVDVVGVDMEAAAVGMVATEGVVEGGVTAVEVVAMEVDVEAVEVDMVVVDMAAVATRPSLDQKNLHKKHFRYKISIHAYLVLFCYAVLSLKKQLYFLHLISDHFS